ncbi:hypothetical protein G5714_014292 [Onychostoma macrolepis]|uniref:Uncharacterized protein n=1 Tax=Onychostoma macrolepis TaxID=369639 RepID=A0A7J6CCZ3_9TELE|nr:hypothetical protein G5714_014292 [Onychostoma macrolepis]
MPRSLEEVWISDSYVLCGRVSSPVAVTSSTGCAGNNAVGKGAGIHFDSLEHEALEDADLLERQRVLESGTRRCGPGVGTSIIGGARVPEDWSDDGVTENHGVPDGKNPLQPKKWRIGAQQTACKSVAGVE